MSKNIVFRFILTVITVTLFSGCYSTKRNFEYEIINNGKAVEITKYIGTRPNVRIPSRIKKLPVIVIGEKAFQYPPMIGEKMQSNNEWVGLPFLTNIHIPNSVTHIGKDAFSFNRLTNIVIPESIILIDKSAFFGSRLDKVTIGSNIIIEPLAFNSNRITSLKIDSNVKIGFNSFKNNNITSLTIGANVILDENYEVFDSELDSFLRSNSVKAGNYSYINDRWIFTPTSDEKQPKTSNQQNQSTSTTVERNQSSNPSNPTTNNVSTSTQQSSNNNSSNSPQIWKEVSTVIGDAILEREYTVITSAQFDRLYRQYNEMYTFANLIYYDVLEMGEGARVLSGTRPRFNSYYHLLVKEQTLAGGIVFLVYGHPNTGRMYIRYNPFAGTKIDSNEFINEYNRYIRWVNGE